jgi:hypothetical protein
MIRPTVSRPVCLGVKPHLGPKTRILLLSHSWEFADVGRPLWREDESVVYNCCWSSPAQSFSGPSPAGLIFETSPTWRARPLHLCLPRNRWPSYTPKHWVHFSSPPTTRRATVEVFEPATMRTFFFRLNSLIGFKVKVMLRPTVRRPVSLGFKPHLRPKLWHTNHSILCIYLYTVARYRNWARANRGQVG